MNNYKLILLYDYYNVIRYKDQSLKIQTWQGKFLEILREKTGSNLSVL